MAPAKANKIEFTLKEYAPMAAYITDIPRLDKLLMSINDLKLILLMPAKNTLASASTGIGRAIIIDHLSYLLKKASMLWRVPASSHFIFADEPFPKAIAQETS